VAAVEWISNKIHQAIEMKGRGASRAPFRICATVVQNSNDHAREGRVHPASPNRVVAASTMELTVTRSIANNTKPSNILQ
jgi:hypothetical protein